MFTRTCPICPTTFETPYSFQICCCRRCSYIQDMLRTKAGKKLKRSEAIAYYGARYDNPFWRFRQSKHYTIIKRIAEFCERRGTNNFTFQEFTAENPDLKQKAQLFSTIMKDTGALRKTGELVKSSKGNCKIIVWRLCVPSAGAKSNSDKMP